MAPRPGHERFTSPTQINQRRYEALRAYFVEGASAAEVAGRLGYARASVETLVRDYRAGRLGELFVAPRPGPVRQPRKDAARALALGLRREGHGLDAIVDALERAGTPLSRTATWELLGEAGLGRIERQAVTPAAPTLAAPKTRVLDDAHWPAAGTVRCEHAGLFLLVPELVALDLPGLVRAAGYPGTTQLQALHSVLALLALKLSGRRRRSHVKDVVHDHALGLFAGLTVLPKAWHLTTYSYRTERRHQQALFEALQPRLRAAGLIGPDSFNLDFHAMMSFGEGEILEKHYVPRRSQRTRSVLSFFAQDGEQHTLVYANADLSARDQSHEVIHFCEFHQRTHGQLPRLLVFDQKLTTHSELARLDELGVGFITLRMRSPKLTAALEALPAERWTKTRLERPGKHRDVSYLEDQVTIAGRRLRQLAVRGLGREHPTLVLTNQHDRTPKQLIERYGQRWGIENHLAEEIRALHLDSLCSQVPLAVDFDIALTVLADLVYRRFARGLHAAYHSKTPDTIRRHFIDSQGELRFTPRHVEVRLARRTYTPHLLDADYPTRTIQVPWWNNRTLSYAFPA
jgi:transposase